MKSSEVNVAWNALCEVNSSKVIQVHRECECFVLFKVSPVFPSASTDYATIFHLSLLFPLHD